VAGIINNELMPVKRLVFQNREGMGKKLTFKLVTFEIIGFFVRNVNLNSKKNQTKIAIFVDI